MKIAKNYNVPVLTPEEAFQENWDVIVDALFGIGLSREITGKYADIIKELNVYYEGAGKIAVDIASGISATTGEVLGTAFQADVTVTFGFEKRGQLLYPGAEYTVATRTRPHPIRYAAFAAKTAAPAIPSEPAINNSFP